MGFKDQLNSFKKSFKDAKLKSIQEDAHKRCRYCDHYVDGTRMCKKHDKKIERATGADGEYCVDWTDFKQQLKKGAKKGMR